MHPNKFTEIVEARIKHSKSTLLDKGQEYSREGDRLHNFKTAGRMDNITPEKALWGMLLKHIVSIRDMVTDLTENTLPSDKLMDDKFDDWHNYGYLLEALIKERTLGTKEDQTRGIKEI